MGGATEGGEGILIDGDPNPVRRTCTPGGARFEAVAARLDCARGARPWI